MKKTLLFVILLFTTALLGCNKIVNKTIAEQKEDDIAKLYIVSYDGKSETKNLIASLGHTFLIIENISNQEIVLAGKYVIAPQEKVTFSWWAVTEHMGLWFNIESYFINIYNRYDTRVSTFQYINKEDIANINDYIFQNDSYSPLQNCSKKCVKVWNICAKDEEKITDYLISNPQRIYQEIMMFNDYQEVIPINIDDAICYIDVDLVSFMMEE